MKSRTARRGRGKAQKTLALIAAAARILEEIQPASIRAVCYRLFTEGLIKSMEKSNTNTVSRLLVGAREDGEIPWGWVVDETRVAESIATWENPTEIIEATVRDYRKNYWTDQPEWVEVWSEKGTIRGTLAPVLDKYGVTFRVMHGYGSATALNDIADQTKRSDKLLTVLYVGDWDPSGLHMSEVDLPDRLNRYGADVNIFRVALDDEHVGPRLPSFEVESKSKDPRYAWYSKRYGRKCWELDALSPVILRDRIELEITSRLDREIWRRAIEVEAVERESMQSFLSKWPSISGQAHK
ncbi:MAG: hypothetical protein A3G81_22520 [Betaproteobacteria bacterium RIFCSPLOWO2_12_FULL_65_14]|nr:MAG: hypothetical protein A3G81_22520 [Betaproteobacteria bacterium RIFCSPLOWO2_12_FULL_65_14]